MSRVLTSPTDIASTRDLYMHLVVSFSPENRCTGDWGLEHVPSTRGAQGSTPSTKINNHKFKTDSPLIHSETR